MPRNDLYLCGMGKSFEELKIARSLLKSLEEIGFLEPTPVQEQAIPVINSGVNVVGIAQTGTGKTAAYLLPLLTRLVKAEGTEPRCIVLVPTRELSVQVGEDIACWEYGAQIGLDLFEEVMSLAHSPLVRDKDVHGHKLT